MFSARLTRVNPPGIGLDLDATSRLHADVLDIQLTADQAPAIRHALEKSPESCIAARRGLRRGAGQHLRAAQRRGKTTVVNPLHDAQAGRRDVPSPASTSPRPANVRQSISLTGQFAAVDEILTGRENLVHGGPSSAAETARIADDLLAQFQLTDAADRRVATYSGGMRRRLDIAMSLIGVRQ